MANLNREDLDEKIRRKLRWEERKRKLRDGIKERSDSFGGKPDNRSIRRKTKRRLSSEEYND